VRPSHRTGRRCRQGTGDEPVGLILAFMEPALLPHVRRAGARLGEGFDLGVGQESLLLLGRAWEINADRDVAGQVAPVGPGNSKGPPTCPPMTIRDRRARSTRLRRSPGCRGAPDWLIANGRPPRRSTQRETNRGDVLPSVSLIPSGARSAEHLILSYRRRVRCRGRCLEILTRKESVQQRTRANTPRRP
jgi:hypothetical protein